MSTKRERVQDHVSRALEALVEPSPRDRIRKLDLYDAYRRWGSSGVLPEYILSSCSFGIYVSQRLPSTRSVWLGVRLRS